MRSVCLRLTSLCVHSLLCGADIFDPDAPPPPGGTPGYAHTQPSTATRAEYLQMSGTEPNNTPWHTDKSGQGDDQYYDMYEGVEKADKLYQDAFQPPNWPNKLERGSQQSHLSSANVSISDTVLQYQEHTSV